MEFNYILDEVQSNQKQINIRVSQVAYEKFEKVKDDMYVKGKTLTITEAINSILIESAEKGQEWLDSNPHLKNVNARRVKPTSKPRKSKAAIVVDTGINVK